MSGWRPYPYQKLVGEHLLEGRSVILQAPTGAGKTAAALLPYLHARRHLSPDDFPRKCIYSVPMRVLANQFHEEYGKIIRRYGWQHDLNVTIQTGDRPDDPRVEGDLVFTTIDQTLSNFLNIPYGLGTRSANLNAGAVLSSYLVFDELHLFDPDTTLPTTLEMLQMLQDITPFIVMTATFSSKMLSRLAEKLGAVVVPENEAQRAGMLKIGSQVGKDRRFFAVDAELTADRVLDAKNQAQRTICICNTVKHAQDLYRGITRELAARGDEETQVCLLHSRFYKDDRVSKEKWIRKQFGIAQENYSGPNLILIATQVIEVGIDATCDIMHTELAPAASILQRAGRCARRKEERGKVLVYLPRDDEGRPDYTPYFLKGKARKTEYGRQLCQATWETLNDGEFIDVHMDFAKEQTFIARVHTPVDEAILDALDYQSSQRRDEMLYTMQTCDRGATSTLIRNVDSRFVVIHPTPETDENLARNPWHYDGFSFSPGTLGKAFAELEEQIDDEMTPWIMQFATRVNENSGRWDEEGPNRQASEWKWCKINDSKEVYSNPVLAIHPYVAHYSLELGILLEPAQGEHHLRPRERKKPFENYAYELETFTEHVTGLQRAYIHRQYPPRTKHPWLPLSDEIAFAAHRLEVRFNLPDGALDRMLRTLFACHDLGKLNLDWQRWAHEWQCRVGKFHAGEDKSIPEDYLAAHTDYDGSREQKTEQRKIKPPRPRHASESAIAAFEILGLACDWDKGFAKAGFTAIARHHSSKVIDYTPFRFHPASEHSLESALQAVGLPPEWAKRANWEDDGYQKFGDGLVDFGEMRELLLYLLLIRVLRLADQRSQIK